jgi:hypothetical protein
MNSYSFSSSKSCHLSIAVHGHPCPHLIMHYIRTMSSNGKLMSGFSLADVLHHMGILHPQEGHKQNIVSPNRG